MTIRLLVRALLVVMTLFLVLYGYNRITLAMRPAPRGCSASSR